MMRTLVWMWFMVLAVTGGATAQVYEPERGSVERRALMDALRPHAEWNLGAPVEFVILDLRVFGDVAFGNVLPQRPGGTEIDLRSTPMAMRGQDVSYLDGTGMQAIYVRSGETWVALHWAIGPTDVWWADPELCAAFYPVISDACGY